MDDRTKKAAVDKAKAIVAHIAFPHELTNLTSLEEHYKSLAFNENEYFLNILRVNKFEIDYDFGQLYDPVNKTHWLEHATPTAISAFYAPFENSIAIPAAMLQGALYSIDRPNYLNYGANGQVIGHEIGHGSDSYGIQGDEHGIVKDWRMFESRWKFLVKVNCIIEQYGSFTEPNTGMNVDGTKTQDENIADNSGLKSAYYAYTKWMQQSGAEPHLPGFKQYSDKQMFWISAAQICCSRNDGKSMSSDEHSPNRFRVIGPVSNRKEFAMDFKCAPGSPMNPIEKCEIW